MGHDGYSASLEQALASERARLVRLCAQLTGSRGAAEDLAQETLLEAWRAIDRVRDRDGLAPWLSAIARYVCLRWSRRQGRDLAHLTHAQSGATDMEHVFDLLAADDEEIAITLERAELVELLDRALAMLPDDTRAALVATYLDEQPQGELARRLEITEGALRVRLHRGRLALRRALETTLRPEALALGLAVTDAPQWQETRIWCPFCGRYRLRCYRDMERGQLSYHCAGDCLSTGGMVMGRTLDRTETHGLTSLKSILTHELLALHTRYQASLRGAVGSCGNCGRPIQVRRLLPADDLPGIELRCGKCGAQDGATLVHLALDTPATQRFWRKHPHMRALPVSEREIAGLPVLVTGFESVEDHARLEVLAARDTFAMLESEEGSR